MDNLLENYLSVIEKNLKPLPISERVDIIKEIKSYIIELGKQDGLSPEEIIEKLGDPKELAKEYLGNMICNDSSFKWSKMRAVLAFYSTTGLGGMFVLPIFTVMAGGFMFCGIIAPIAGLIKAGGYLIGIDVPFVSFKIGSFSLHPLLQLPATLGLGALLYWAGKGSWKIVLKYVNTISNKKRKLDAYIP
mgnify:CR=1 FL=1